MWINYFSNWYRVEIIKTFKTRVAVRWTGKNKTIYERIVPMGRLVEKKPALKRPEA